MVFAAKDIFIVVESAADESAVALLKRTVYGTKGPRYQHTGQEIKVGHLRNPFFFRLIRESQTIGFYCLTERDVDTPVGRMKGFYGRYLAVDEEEKGKGFGRLLKAEAAKFVERHVPPPLVLFSYIEESNIRSLRISETEGFSSIATLETTLFSRLSPELDNRFGRLDASEYELIRKQLDSFYEEYTFKTFENIGYGGNYFVLREAGEVIAGVQANPVAWRFVSMPGIGGWAMMHLFPMVPGLKKLFNPTHYQFLALEGLFLKPGQEEALFSLLESALSHFGFSSAMLQLDTKDPLLHLLKSSGRLGVMNQFKKSITTHVMAKLLSAGGKQPIQLAHQPVYVSSFDFT